MMIYYFTPFDVNKNIGKTHNAHCELVANSEDWICIRDGDTMFLNSDYGRIIEKAIAEHGDNYDAFTCYTNRIGVPELRYKNVLFDEQDLDIHIDIANNIKEDTTITDVRVCAGYFMLFKKSIWEQVGGFNENSIRFDIEFSSKLQRIGRINSLYVLHLYRWGKANPSYYIKHLVTN